MKLKCNFDFKFKNPPRVLSCIFGFEVCFFKLEFKPTVLVWMKNVKNYVEEAETYILNDEHTHQEVVGDEWYPGFKLEFKKTQLKSKNAT